ncbi:Membrane protein putatively involved in long-chain fatty acid transport [Elusimicrobium minutum Pei191]|uniref:Membrane protein putatively involved in long-chain fatty acid transport n=1 Tax=Elusimicrobium minutum (strain Pei191) TaxID=445932 RepID=B2KDF7_ELUMP|nr:outer membrane protein transport protein [Elusimicrobium minutum]ACC98553.1 Membrane protein putatively involved in long-chain fatty acid transport [Elusimicrobium minutum Pei191]
MKFKILKKALLCLMPFCCGIYLNAAGFALYEFSARGNAMGGAVLANKAEPASIASNPALITQLEGAQIQAGVTAIIVEGSTSLNNDKRDLETGVFYLPTFYFTKQMREHIVLGVGFFSRFGLGGKYKDYGTWLPAISERQSYRMDLVTYSFNPVMASQVTDELSLAGGFEIMYASLTEEKGPGNANRIEIEGDSITWGANFGLHYKPEWADKWAAAVTYRTKTRHLASGKVTGHGLYSPATGDATAALALPDQLAFGLSFTPTERLILEAGITGVFWSSYKQLKIDYDDLSKGSSNEYKHYRDVFRLSSGMEFAVTENWDIRFGYVYDESPINPDFMDTMVPADDRHIFSTGLGYKRSNWGADISYSYMYVKDLSGTTEHGTPAKYENARSQMIGLSLKYAF